jgi:hypothetical protein
VRTVKTVLLVALILVCAIVSAGLWLNRGSEKIVTAFCLGLAAMIAASASVLIFGAPEPIHKAFSTKTMIEGQSYIPAEFVGFSAIPLADLLRVRDELTSHPELGEPEDKSGATLYHHALQRALVSWLQQKYLKSWETEILPYDFGEAHGYVFTYKSTPTTNYGADQLTRRMAGNKFAHLQPFGQNLGLAVPPGTEMAITPPHHDERLGEFGKITFTNRYATITIETREAGFQTGVGSYAGRWPRASGPGASIAARRMAWPRQRRASIRGRPAATAGMRLRAGRRPGDRGPRAPVRETGASVLDLRSRPRPGAGRGGSRSGAAPPCRRKASGARRPGPRAPRRATGHGLAAAASCVDQGRPAEWTEFVVPAARWAAALAQAKTGTPHRADHPHPTRASGCLKHHSEAAQGLGGSK